VHQLVKKTLIIEIYSLSQSNKVILFQLTDCLSSLVWSTSIEHAKELLSLSNESFVDSLNDALVS